MTIKQIKQIKNCANDFQSDFGYKPEITNQYVCSVLAAIELLKEKGYFKTNNA